MKPLFTNGWWGAGLIGVAVVVAAAQNPAPPPIPSQPARPQPPLPQLARPYTAFFRELLVASSEEQERLLVTRASDTQAVLRRKLEEYRSLPQAECQARLRALDLRWYLTQLLPLPRESRQTALRQIPEEDQLLVEQRLYQWDQLSPDLQQAVRESEMAIRLLSSPGGPPRQVAGDRSPGAMAKPSPTDEAIARWKALSPDRRQQIHDHFCSIFELETKERQEALARLSAQEQAQWTETLRGLAGLPKSERERCLQGFRRFVGLSRPEREQFLRNAERWQQMDPAEQQLWRTLVGRFPAQPPQPPSRPAPKPPPLPPPLKPTPVLSGG